MLTIDLDKVKAKVIELASENPDNVYNSGSNGKGCMYTKGNCSDGTVGCIVGQAIRDIYPEAYKLVLAAESSERRKG